MSVSARSQTSAFSSGSLISPPVVQQVRQHSLGLIQFGRLQIGLGEPPELGLLGGILGVDVREQPLHRRVVRIRIVADQLGQLGHALAQHLGLLRGEPGHALTPDPPEHGHGWSTVAHSP